MAVENDDYSTFNLFKKSELSSSDNVDKNIEKIEKYFFDITLDKSEDSNKNEATNNEQLYDQLIELKKYEELARLKNNWLHNYLANYFKKKHLMHVFTETDEYEEDKMDDYIQKLMKFERINKKLKCLDEEWRINLEEIKAKIIERRSKVAVDVEDMIKREKEAGLNTWINGKLISPKKVQSLITKQLDEMQRLSEQRFKYMNLRNKLVLLTDQLNSMTHCNPNLTKEDYERLEAENFYYQEELSNKENKRKQLLSKIASIRNEIKLTNLEIKNINKEMDLCHIKRLNLNQMINNYQRERRVIKNKLLLNDQILTVLKKNYKDAQSGVLETEMMDLKKEHEEGIKIIAQQLRELKHLRASTSALKTDFILHGKNIELNLRPVK
ncbi:uncharacterized protein [Chelonus insularis]|uniref:uncharacterized protein n=1 Tax=Chelonus insularis TaxID=460826 RepID=UPI00158B2108|nr:uncharacterized protein LOC118065831 [Chelonus insularis]